MKPKVAFVLFVLALYDIECHLITNQIKTEDFSSVTTDLWVGENETERNSKFQHDTEVFMSKEQHVYFEDMFHSVKSQNWSKDEEPCLNQTLLMLKSLQNFTLWAVWEWDSKALEPTGLLFGNQYQLGNFDECLKAPWKDTHPELRTHYCLADVKLEKTDNAVKRRLDRPLDPYLSALDYMQEHSMFTRPINDLTWGLCVPSSCEPKSVKRLLALMLARSHLGTAGMRPQINVDQTCQTKVESKNFDAVFYSFFFVMGSLFTIAIICTVLNSYREDDGKVLSIKGKICKAFCLKENAKNLLIMHKDGVEVLYGIRFLTISFIVVDHRIGFTAAVAVINGRQVDQLTMQTEGLFVLHNDLFVDTFFWMSGFLTATHFLRLRSTANPIVFILKRYIRLVIAFAVTIYFVVAIFPYTGSGPIWPRVVEAESEVCRKSWWISLLMLGNYIDLKHFCLAVTWYIPCDFHFFAISVLLFWIYQRLPSTGLVCASVVTAAAVIAPGVIVYMYQLPATHLFTFEFMQNPRSTENTKVYIASHMRAAAYIVGFAGGCLFSYYKATGNLKRINQTWSIIGAVAGFATMVTMMLLGPTFMWGSYKPVASALYAALNRPVWAGGLTLLVFCCALGHVPLVKSFLSWYPWVPLSRLAYGLYLTQTVFLLRNSFSTRSPEYFDHWKLFQDTAGLMGCGYTAAFAIWLIAEAPANNLLTALLTPARFNKPQAGPLGSQNNSVNNLALAADNRSHLQENLPGTITNLDTISSKI